MMWLCPFLSPGFQVWSYGFTTIGRSASSTSSSSRSTPNGNGGGGGSSSGNGSSTVGSGSGPDVVEGLGSAGHGLQDAMVRGGGAGGGSRFKMAGLGFGLPLSRLYARYFGERGRGGQGTVGVGRGGGRGRWGGPSAEGGKEGGDAGHGAELLPAPLHGKH